MDHDRHFPDAAIDRGRSTRRERSDDWPLYERLASSTSMADVVV